MTTPEHSLVGIHAAIAVGAHQRFGWAFGLAHKAVLADFRRGIRLPIDSLGRHWPDNHYDVWSSINGKIPKETSVTINCYLNDLVLLFADPRLDTRNALVVSKRQITTR